MNVSLTPQMVKFVEEQVASGDYQSASEVVRAGLRLLHDQKEDRNARLERLRKEIAVGIEQLDRGESFSMEDVFRELRQRNRRMEEESA
jgi:antitoxin ParD1/3/4